MCTVHYGEGGGGGGGGGPDNAETMLATSLHTAKSSRGLNGCSQRCFMYSKLLLYFSTENALNKVQGLILRFK